MRVSLKSRTRPAVDLSAMLDVIFQLVLFFLVSTSFNIYSALNVSLPSSESAALVKSEGLVISVEEDGALWLNEKNISDDELLALLLEFDTGKILRAEFPVFISADKNARNGRIVELLDIIREGGFSCVNLMTAEKNDMH
ncbi:ExbD/TolR family protein [Treponema sp.]|uniref:ExbD/TolR family protein n=1 Tax=Treponema sp. TaxID=166 RepID=UPI003EFE0F18